MCIDCKEKKARYYCVLCEAQYYTKASISIFWPKINSAFSNSKLNKIEDTPIKLDKKLHIKLDKKLHTKLEKKLHTKLEKKLEKVGQKNRQNSPKIASMRSTR